MAETVTTVDTSPDTEVLTLEEQDSLQVGEALVAEQENLLAGKYKDAQELEKAYIELQSKLGEQKEEKEEPTQELEIEKEEKELEEPDTSFLDRLWDEANTKYTDETMQELSKMDPNELARQYIKYRSDNEQPQITDDQVNQLKGIAGGEKEYKGMMDWASNNLQKNEIDMYDKVMEKGDPTACYFAVQALKYRFDDASGVEGEMLTGKAPSNKGDQFKSQAQVVEAMNDPKYDKDPAYRREVMEKLERSDIKF